MARETPPRDVLSRLADLLGLGGLDSMTATLESLERQTRAQLLDWSRRLGLTGVRGLTKDALARRLQQTLTALGIGETPSEGDGVDPPDVARRFELGRPADRVTAPEHIPWSYGQDRVTAMAVDPDRLYVYWEVTDEAMARARAGLGAGGADAWLDLRIYDVTSRLFDGTNAHGYFDVKVERGDRQWFSAVGKPSSTAVVEIGLKSFEGYFVRTARSGRVDFPRREPAPPGGVEWLTVRAATGEVASPVTVPEPPPAAAPVADPLPAHLARLVSEEQLVPGEAFQDRPAWQEAFDTAWHDGERTLEWHGPAVRTTWEAGPFEASIESPVYVEEWHHGTGEVQEQNGRVRVVYGPWQVVIRGLGAHAERQVVATWEMSRSWMAPDGKGAVPAPAAPRVAGGSEQVARGTSEVRLGGTSEIWRLGATELRFLGASERLYAGGSERALRGASEWRVGGASERAYGGASEQRAGGASEAPLPYPSKG